MGETFIDASDIVGEEETFIRADDIVETEPRKPIPKVTRPSNVIKQGLAGLSDVATGLPMLAGMIGTGVSTAFDRDDDPKTSYLDEALKNLQTSDTYQFGLRGRGHVNRFLDIEEPSSTEDQITRLATSLAIPGIGWLSALSKGGTLANIARLLTPVVKMTGEGRGLLNKGNVLRLGTQLGLGTGIDQTVRGAMGVPDLPTMFSEQALHGSISKDDILPASPSIGNDSADMDRRMRNQDWREGMAVGLAVLFGSIGGIYALSRLSKVKQVPTNFGEAPEQGSKVLANVKEAVSSQDGAKNVYNRVVEEVVSKGQATYVGMIDKSEGLVHAAGRALRHDLPEDRAVTQMENLRDNTTVDAAGKTSRYELTGELPSTGKRNEEPLAEVLRNVNKWDQSDQALFYDVLKVNAEDTVRTRATALKLLSDEDIAAKLPGDLRGRLQQAWNDQNVQAMDDLFEEFRPQIQKARGGRINREQVGLWSHTTRRMVTDVEIKNIQGLAKERPHVWDAAKAVAKTNDDILENSVDRKVLDDWSADLWRRQSTNANGLFYVPMKDMAEYGTWWRRLGEKFGLFTHKGQEMKLIGNLHTRGLTQAQGPFTPVDGIRASQDYHFHMMDHVDRSVNQWNFGSRAAGIQDIDSAGKVIYRPGYAKFAQESTDPSTVRYIGRIDPRHDLNKPGSNSVHLDDINTSDPRAKEIARTVEAATPDNVHANPNVTPIHHQGKFYLIHSEDVYFNKAMLFNSSLQNGVLRFLNQWKKTFTQFVTGILSPFGVTSFLYNQQLGSLAAMIHAPKGRNIAETVKNMTVEGAATWVNSIRGAHKVFSYEIARKISPIVSRHVAEDIGAARIAPGMMAKLEKTFERIIGDSILGPIERETGLSKAAIDKSEFGANIVDILEDAMPSVSKTRYGNVMPSLWRMWTSLNTAAHEGTALGVIMREAAKEGVDVAAASPAQLRHFKRLARERVGDVTRRGASPIADVLNAAVPFSGAMLQSWAVMGRAMRPISLGGKNSMAKWMPAIVATIGLPAATEVVWNSTIEDDTLWEDSKGQLWSYRDYYWNHFSTEQRNNNVILFIPGKPPWESIVQPITPEFSLVRAIAIEGIDAIFGFSEVGVTGKTGDNGDHWRAAIKRVLDIPVPPVINAAMNALAAVTLRVGPNEVVTPGEGEGTSFVSTIPLGMGDRYTSTYGEDRAIGDEFDKRVTAVLNSLFGAGGAALVAMANAFFPEDNTDPVPLEKRLSDLGTTFTHELARGVRVATPLYGRTMEHNPSVQPVAKEAISKIQGLKEAQKKLLQVPGQGGGMMVQSETEATTRSMPIILDPVYQHIAMNATNVLADVQVNQDQISKLRAHISETRNAARLKDGTPLTPEHRRDIIDAYNITMTQQYAEMALTLKGWEAYFAAHLSGKEQLNRPVDIDFATLKPRSNPR